MTWQMATCCSPLPVSTVPPTKSIEETEKVKPDQEKEVKLDWNWVWELIKPDVLLLGLAVVAAGGAAIMNVQLSATLGELVNVVAAAGSTDVIDLQKPALTVLAMAAAQAGLTCSYISLLATVGERVCERLRNDLYRSLLCQDMGFFDVHQTGEIVDRLSGDVHTFKSSFKDVISHGLRNMTQAAGSIVAMLMISKEMGGAVIFSLPLMIGVGRFIGLYLKKLSSDAKRATSSAVSRANEVIGNIRTVRAFAAEDDECAAFEAYTEESRSKAIMLGVGIGIFQGLSHMMTNGVVLSVLYFGGTLMQNSDLQPGSLMSFLISAQTMQRSLAHMSMVYGTAMRGAEAGARVMEYIRTQPAVPVKGGTRPSALEQSCGVKFDGVTFSYPSRPNQKVLENFVFEIPAGKVVALCGPSGSGKSTVAAMVERFYDPGDGSILLNDDDHDHDLKEVDPQWLRGDLIGYINQEPVLFAGTILSNIRYGIPNATMEQVEEAARQANAHTFISEFPDGYNTVVGERGVTVSGGQRQRIAIARALLKNPRVLILDEATSALDAESERLVQDAISRLTVGRTVLVIAHRLSTIQDADIIAVLKKGKVVEQGTHSELLEKDGMYADLVAHQLSQDE